jgi:hypothetical protein
MYRKYFSGICLVGIAALLAGCGSSSSTSSTPSTGPLTNLKKRVLVSVISPTGGNVFIIDGQKDALATKTVAVTQPSKMLTASGTTLILNSTLSNITIFDNATEAVTFNTAMQGQPFDIALSPDGLTAYAAIRNVGVVEVVNTKTGSIVGTMNIPSPARLVEGPSGHKQLAFADDPQILPGSQSNAFFVIDTGTNTFVPIQMPAGSQPYTAVFDPSDANDTTAFILNCGTECGGSAPPSVAKVNFATPSSPVITFVGGTPIAGATVGLLSGSSLFVAGTPSGSATGTLQVINTGTLTAGSAISITNGLHGVMATTTNGRLYIGASQCTPGPVTPQLTVTGCLSIFNTTTQSVVIPSESSLRQNFNVTGLQPISNRNVIYVVQSGELDFFDTTTDAVSATITPIDISGIAIDALQIDP